MTLSMKWMRLFLIGFLALGLFHCNDQVSGATETGNTGPKTLTGRLVTPDGLPARGAVVRVRPAGALADTSGRLAKTGADTTSAFTNSQGVYAIDTGLLDPGTFVIEGSDGAGSRVLIQDVEVTDPAVQKEVPQDTLKPAGALKGVIRLSQGGDLRKVLVLAFGIDRFVQVKADGTFKFSQLAESEYNLRILATIDGYGVLDLTGVAVPSADTLDLDTLSLPFTGIPVPRGVSLTYDTLLQSVLVTWEAADPALVLGYNLYRKHTDSDYVKVNPAIITDTSFEDAALHTTAAYQYKVAAVSLAGSEGVRSAGVSVSFCNRLERRSSAAPFGSRTEHSCLFLWGRLWVIAGSDGGVLKGDIWSSADGISWTRDTGSAGFGPRRQHASIVYNDKLWVIGGRDTTRELNDAWFSEDGISWTQAVDSAGFSPRMGHAAVSLDGRMWVIGGFGDGFLGDVWSSTDGVTWVRASDSAPFGPRMGHAVVDFLGSLWLVGGEGDNGHLNDTWTSSDGIIWMVAAPAAAFAGRNAFSMGVHDGSLWIIGGHGQTNGTPGPFADVWFTGNGIHWRTFNAPPDFEPRSHHASAAGDGVLWITGGTGADASVWRLR